MSLRSCTQIFDEYYQFNFEPFAGVEGKENLRIEYIKAKTCPRNFYKMKEEYAILEIPVIKWLEV